MKDTLWQRFLGLVRGENAPDANTIWQFKEDDMGGIHTRTIGLERNTRDNVAKSLAYNIKRAAFLFSQKAKKTAA